MEAKKEKETINYEGIRGTPMDDLLKLQVVKHFELAIDYSIRGELRPAFRAYKALFHFIEPFDFTLKRQLTDITIELSNYMNQLETKPIDEHDRITINEKVVEVKEILNLYMSELPKAYAELGLWFKIIKTNVDFDQKLSKENFNSPVKLINMKKETLLELPPKRMLELFKPNAIHDAYARLSIDNAVY